MTELLFKGKEFVFNHHLTVPFRPLVPHPEKGIGPARLDGNLIIHGDNLHGLKALLPMYAGKIDCIFIDPPYNTGNEGWSYNDNVNSPMIKEWLSANPIGIEDGLRHDKWCAMMWPRLRLLHELLAEDGSIFVSIDDNELARLRLVMDEIFGVENFIANFVWQSKDTPGNNSSGIAETHNHIIFYSKNMEFKGSLLDRTEDQIANYSNPDNDPRGEWLGAPLTRAEYRERDYYSIKNKIGKSVYPPTGSSWRRPPNKMKWLAQDNRIWWGKDGAAEFPMEKKFLKEVKQGVINQTWWPYEFAGSTRNAGAEIKEIFNKAKVFETPKPVELIERILSLIGNPSALVLDSFAGSATTAHAVIRLNATDGGARKFILVQLSEETPEDSVARREGFGDVIEITAERIRRVIKGYAFAGTQKTELLREPLNWRALQKADALVRKVEAIENLHGHEYDRIKKDVKDGELIVTGEKSVQERTEGLGGEFTYCTLGDPVEIDAILSGKALPTQEALASVLWHMATARTFDPTTMTQQAAIADGLARLGAHDGRTLWLIYKPDLDWLKSADAALSLAKARALAASGEGEHLVFAPAKFVSRDLLQREKLKVDYAPLPFALYKLETA